MNIKGLENLMFQLSDFFLAPVLLLLVALFAYSLFALGGFACQWFQRNRYKRRYEKIVRYSQSQYDGGTLQGYPLTQMFLATQKKASKTGQGFPLSKDHLDVAALKELEAVRTVSRLAPMLGLIATMVPMGPALKSLADGNVQGISENLIVAFSAVIFGLVIASITFWIATIKKRWLATELVNLQPLFDKTAVFSSVSEIADVVEHKNEAA